MHVYCILNIRNGKRYIGITTVSVNERWGAHLREAFAGSPRALCRAIRKYGRESFVVELIASMAKGTSWEDLTALERLLIAQESTFGPGGYNMTNGGEGVSAPVSEATRAKKRAHWTPEKREAHRQRNVARVCAEKAAGTFKASPGSPWTDERKVSQGDKVRGRKAPNETRTKIKAGWTEERRAAVSARAAAKRALSSAPQSEGIH